MSNQTVLSWLISLRPAIPMSIEQKCSVMSNSELRRHITQGGVLINNKKCNVDDIVEFPVQSLVFFPKSPKRRTTLW